MKLTAETITDEQIRELRDQSPTGSGDRHVCFVALGLSKSIRRMRRGDMRKAVISDARARCAEIINAPGTPDEWTARSLVEAVNRRRS